MVGCVQDVLVKNIFLLQFEDDHNKEMSSCLLQYLCSKEEVEMDEPLSNSPKKEQGELFAIECNP